MTVRRANTRGNVDLGAMDATNPALDAVRQKRHSLCSALDEFEHVTGLHSPPRSFYPVETVRALFDQLAHRFAAHVEALDALLAPLSFEPLPVAQLTQENEELDAMFQAFRETLDRPAHRERDEQLRVQAADLVALLRSQLRKEETLVFAIAARTKSHPSPKRRTPRGDRP